MNICEVFNGLPKGGRPDAEALIQLRGGDRLWQKERLLNLAMEALPSHCDQVMWIDADIVVDDIRWASEVSAALEAKPVVQPYRLAHYLDTHGVPTLSSPSTISAWQPEVALGEVLASTLNRGTGAPCSGHVWAARRNLLQRHGLYDGCIVGGGDTAFLCGATGNFEEVMGLHRMGEAQRVRYLQWAEPLFEETGGEVGSLPTEIKHLWHGPMGKRRGRERHEGLAEIGFDPFTDVGLSATGLWQWTSNRPALHRYVSDYFVGRDEDSQLATAESASA